MQTPAQILLNLREGVFQERLCDITKNGLADSNGLMVILKLVVFVLVFITALPAGAISSDNIE